MLQQSHAGLAVMRAGFDAAGNDRILVANHSTFASGPFRVAVLAGAQSFSIEVANLGGRAFRYFSLPNLDCTQPVAVIVDIDKQTGDPNFANNSIGFDAGCKIDDGIAGNPVSE